MKPELPTTQSYRIEKTERPKRSWWFNITKKKWLNEWGELNSTQKALMLTLWLYAGRKNICYPSMRTLARDLKMDKETINLNIKILIKNSYIEATRKTNQKGNYHEYKLLK